MLKMRLQRVGRRQDPKFRVVVTQAQTGPTSGKHVDTVGSYDAKNGVIKLNAEKITEWLAKGVQASDTVHNMLVNEKIIKSKKINALPKKTPIAKETVAEEAAPVAKPAPNLVEEAEEKVVEETPDQEVTEEPVVKEEETEEVPVEVAPAE